MAEVRIESVYGDEIRSFEDWARIYENPQQSHQWVEHRSAMSIAQYVMQRNGLDKIMARVAKAAGQDVTLERVVPEFEQRFDGYGRGRVHDLGLFGTVADGRSVFVGVEAKVDESFGPTVKERYLGAKANQITGTSTNAPERIEQLLAMHYAEANKDMFNVRYQLLYATAGTLAVGADIALLYVLVFRTPQYDEVIGAENYRDYLRFVTSVGGKSMDLGEPGLRAHELSLDGKRLLCLHEVVEHA